MQLNYQCFHDFQYLSLIYPFDTHCRNIEFSKSWYSLSVWRILGAFRLPQRSINDICTNAFCRRNAVVYIKAAFEETLSLFLSETFPLIFTAQQMLRLRMRYYMDSSLSIKRVMEYLVWKYYPKQCMVK